MKQIIIFFLVLAATLSLTACVNNDEKATESSFTSTQVQASERVEAPAETEQTAPAAPAPQEQAKPIDEHQKAVSDLKNRLAKIDGMKTGSKEFYSFSYKYLEKENVIEHKWKQSIVPKEAADQEVLRALKQEGIKCIVYYPDDTEMFRVSFPFNELYLDN